MRCMAWSFIRLEGTTVTDAGTSRSGVSVLVAVEDRVARYPVTGPSARSASPCTRTSGSACSGRACAYTADGVESSAIIAAASGRRLKAGINFSHGYCGLARHRETAGWLAVK